MARSQAAAALRAEFQADMTELTAEIRAEIARQTSALRVEIYSATRDMHFALLAQTALIFVFFWFFFAMSR